MQACIKAVFPHNRQGEVGVSLVRGKNRFSEKKERQVKKKKAGRVFVVDKCGQCDPPVSHIRGSCDQQGR